MTYDQALQKAIKCLELSKSDNQHEAALAASRAQEIIDRYNLCVEDIQQGKDPKGDDENIVDFGFDPLHEVCQVDTRWTLRLASTIARLNGCRIYYSTKISGSAIFKLVGRPSDVQSVRYLFAWLEKEVRRITRAECKGCSRKYQIDFRSGVVDTIQHKLDAQRKETFDAVQKEARNPFALVLVKNSIARIEAKGNAVDKWLEENMELRQPKFRAKSDWSARAHGQEAGNDVRFTKAVADLN
jgi:hypothetical protein